MKTDWGVDLFFVYLFFSFKPQLLLAPLAIHPLKWKQHLKAFPIMLTSFKVARPYFKDPVSEVEQVYVGDSKVQCVIFVLIYDFYIAKSSI